MPSQQPPSVERLLADIPASTPTLKLPWQSTERLPLWRLDDEECFLFQRQGLAIKEDYWFLMQLRRHCDERLPLAKAFTALAELAGPSSKSLDTYKQSFRFPFLHALPVGKPSAMYLLIVQDIRGSLYFTSRRVVSADDPRLLKHLLHEPFAEELSREELNRLTATFHGYLEGYSEFIVPQPFVKTVQSEHIIYGYADGAYFEEQHNCPHAFADATAIWTADAAISQEADTPTVLSREH